MLHIPCDKKYLVVSKIEDGETEIEGIFTGNIFEIMYKYFLKTEVNAIYDPVYHFHDVSKLEQDGIFYERVQSNSIPKHIKGKYLNGVSLLSPDNFIRIQKDFEEFKKQYPNVKTEHDSYGVSFIDVDDKVKKELENLSPETLEFIRKNGI